MMCGSLNILLTGRVEIKLVMAKFQTENPAQSASARDMCYKSVSATVTHNFSSISVKTTEIKPILIF